MITHEQISRDILERMGIENAQSFSSGEIIELANKLREIEQLRAMVADGELALDLLAELFDKYENGDDCYEDPDEGAGYVGKAFMLDNSIFDACANLLNRLRPVNAAPQQEQEGEGRE